MPSQDADGLLTLGIRGANGWSVVAQVSRSLYCDGTSIASQAGRREGGGHAPRSLAAPQLALQEGAQAGAAP